MFNITDSCNIDNTKINIKKPYVFYHLNRIHFDIFYDNSPFLVMTKMIQVCIKGMFYMKFIQSTKNGCLHNLDRVLQNIYNRVVNHDEFKKRLVGKFFFSGISNDDKWNKVLVVKNICFTDTRFFDTENEVITVSNIKQNDNVRLIIYIKNLWVGENEVGINLKISQLQRLEPLFLSYSLFEIKNNNKKIPNPPPPPPLPKNKKKIIHDVIDWDIIKKKEILKIVPEVTRPSLNDIIDSKNKLRKTKYIMLTL